MKDKILAALHGIEDLAHKAVAAAPFVCGIAVGCILSEPIKIVLGGAIAILRAMLKI